MNRSGLVGIASKPAQPAAQRGCADIAAELLGVAAALRAAERSTPFLSASDPGRGPPVGWRRPWAGASRSRHGKRPRAGGQRRREPPLRASCAD